MNSVFMTVRPDCALRAKEKMPTLHVLADGINTPEPPALKLFPSVHSAADDVLALVGNLVEVT